ncbi:radical SAM protein [Vibrio splendidus]|uniref:radical SAM protein n=1 Tax=Vibrio splendidus TaxID=29497 RepID=UPI0024683ED0|nr:radical SAM protein [Vibrio splendidus]MDH5975187.1 radical SAM protein [Vibrio splendidus]
MSDSNCSALDWVVFKITQKCNLNCTYCYVYNRGDDGWKNRPSFVSDEVVLRLAKSIKLHTQRYSLRSFNIEFHGGEPLLNGKNRIKRIVEIFESELSEITVKFHLQTNGTLLDKEWVLLFDELNISFGLSLDGAKAVNDKYRIDINGRGSTNRVLERLSRVSFLPEFKRTFGGVLCVLADIDTCSPKELIDWFQKLEVGSVDFLFPDGNYSYPPPEIESMERYAKYLVDMFEYWIQLPEDAINVRLFDHLIRGLFGETTPLDSLGGDLTCLCVVESDGSIGDSDVGRICPPLRANPHNIFEHDLDLHMSNSFVSKVQTPCNECQSCEYFSMCGGGYLPHRYDGTSFNNISYYCSVLKSLSSVINEYVKCEIKKVRA